MSTNPHTVTVTAAPVDEDGWHESPTVTFTCSAPPDAPCHVYPDDDSRDSWTAEEAALLGVPHDRCWMADWFDVGPEAAPYGGDDVERDFDPPNVTRTGPIDHEYDECVIWTWAEVEQP